MADSSSGPAARPRGYDEFSAALGRVVTPEGVARGLAFRPRPTDIVISPYAKCGTTWLQQIVHGLRTHGDMDFDDISRVVPWIETAHDLGIDLDAEQRANPRAFKSHLPWHPIPKGARYVVSLRDPKDALASMYRFMEGWFFEPDTVTIDELVLRRSLDRSEGRDYWTHFASWWARRGDPGVLLLAYELVKEDLPGTVRRVADFAGIEADDTLVDLVAEQASLPFMLAHKDRFDDLLMRRLSERVCGLPAGSDSAKVRQGEVGSGVREMSAQVAERIDAMWRDAIETELGLGSYQEAVEILRGALPSGRCGPG
jgi:hypothetical protein